MQAKKTRIIARKTKTGQRILDLFSDTQMPISAVDILESLHRLKIAVNKTTIYRRLYQFVEMGILKTIDFGDGIKRFESANLDHHHHLICENCKEVQDIEIKNEKYLDVAKKDHNFKIVRHSLEIFGLCSNCQ